MKTIIVAWVPALLLATTAIGQSSPEQQRVAAERFGTEIVRAMNERDQVTIAKMLDFNALVERSADFQGLTGKTREGYVKAAGSVGVGRIIETLFRVLDSSESSVKFLRATHGTPPRSLIRLDFGPEGCNYIEYVLRTDAQGRTRSVDWFQLATGELMSVSLATMNQMLVPGNPGLLERLLGGATVTAETARRLHQISELHRAKKYEEALKLLKQLPAAIQNTRLILTMRASTASLAGLTDEYDRALEKLAEHHSDDPATSFMLIDYYFNQKNTPQVLKAVDTMERRVGVDGVTSLLRSNAYLVSNDLANALKYAEESIRLEPDRLDGYDTRATLLVQLERFAEAVDAYRDMEQRFGIRFARENFQDPVFEPLLASKPFRTWLPK